MASKYWIKLYHEVLEDPKMGTLPDNLWRRAIELFLLAGEIDKDGFLPTTQEIAWKLRHDVVTIRDELQQLSVTGIVTAMENDTWLVTNFSKRQSAADDKERKRRQRQRESTPKYGESAKKQEIISHENVTNRDIDTDTDTDTIPSVGDKSPDVSKSRDGNNQNNTNSRVGQERVKSKSDTGKNGESQPGPKKRLMAAFLEKTHLTMPHKKNEVGFWWSNITEIFEISNQNENTGIALISGVVKEMFDKKLTIKGPESIVGMCRARASGQSLNGKTQVDYTVDGQHVEGVIRTYGQ